MAKRYGKPRKGKQKKKLKFHTLKNTLIFGIILTDTILKEARHTGTFKNG